jgi:hypothetical protein
MELLAQWFTLAVEKRLYQFFALSTDVLEVFTPHKEKS